MERAEVRWDNVATSKVMFGGAMFICGVIVVVASSSEKYYRPELVSVPKSMYILLIMALQNVLILVVDLALSLLRPVEETLNETEAFELEDTDSLSREEENDEVIKDDDMEEIMTLEYQKVDRAQIPFVSRFGVAVVSVLLNFIMYGLAMCKTNGVNFQTTPIILATTASVVVFMVMLQIMLVFDQEIFPIKGKVRAFLDSSSLVYGFGIVSLFYSSFIVVIFSAMFFQ
ncbi:hypothetical protein TRICI_002249 [Trichomonascus ciferrii]|uniref:Uncharacterized protein n=1 Tax=Trichomonascus ciferrii TaxID=44093 RepID=A0A642V719_9ASCO|nr:hypothetical protein TRICI_002249 [Trichomonascus ciferrii]